MNRQRGRPARIVGQVFGRGASSGDGGNRATWRLVVPPAWGTRGDPAWLPSTGGDGWRNVFRGEDMAAHVLRDQGRSLPWRLVADASAGLASVLAYYRDQLRVAEDEAAHCQGSRSHLAALAAAGDGAEPPSRSHPTGPWRVRVLANGSAAVVGRYPSVDGAEGDAAGRRTGDASVVCWAEPDVGPGPPITAGAGWRPRVDPDVRYAAFAVEEAVAALCAGAADGATGPDVLDVGLLCLLGEAAWRSIQEYRTLMAAVWVDLEACAQAEVHDTRAEAAVAASTDPVRDGPAGPWRHLLMVERATGLAPVEVSVHQGQAGAAASVAVDRATDDEGLHWAEPVVVGPRADLGHG